MQSQLGVMTMLINKFQLSAMIGIQFPSLPADGVVRAVGYENGGLCLWVESTGDRPAWHQREMLVVATWTEFVHEPDVTYRYLGMAMHTSSEYHVYEVLRGQG